jgi:hypothetical protein
MLYVLRLSTGDCIITEAQDETCAHDFAVAYGLDDGESVVSVRPLSRFAARFSPNDSASFDVTSWDDPTLDNILACEYPLLNESFRQANSVPLMNAATAGRDILNQLKESHEQNLEIIRKGLRIELQRFTPQSGKSEDERCGDETASGRAGRSPVLSIRVFPKQRSAICSPSNSESRQTRTRQ